MRDYSKRADEELRVEVALALGWTDIHTLDNGVPYGWHPEHHPKAQHRYETPLPNFPHDLNACHAFEEALDGAKNQINKYCYALSRLCGEDPPEGVWFSSISATARQRCIALLRVLAP